MSNPMTDQWKKVVALLCGRWAGDGKGYFPTIDSFDYRETFSVEQRDATSLFYDQRTDKRPVGSTEFEVSHWESGFIRLLPSGTLELTNAHSGGRAEVMTGEFVAGDQLQIAFRSKALTNDYRMVETTRTFTLSNNTFCYKMGMFTVTTSDTTATSRSGNASVASLRDSRSDSM